MNPRPPEPHRGTSACSGVKVREFAGFSGHDTDGILKPIRVFGGSTHRPHRPGHLRETISTVGGGRRDIRSVQDASEIADGTTSREEASVPGLATVIGPHTPVGHGQHLQSVAGHPVSAVLDRHALLNRDAELPRGASSRPARPGARTPRP